MSRWAASHRVFEDAGGKVLKKIWVPLGAADDAPFIAQIGDCDAGHPRL